MLGRYQTYIFLFFIFIGIAVADNTNDSEKSNTLSEPYNNTNDTFDLRPEYILFGNYHLNYHNAKFSYLPLVKNCCPQFENGEGKGYSFGINYQFRTPYHLDIGLGLGYYVWNATISADENKIVEFDDRSEQGLCRHILDVSISDIGFTPYLSYNIIDRFNIFGGGHIGFIIKSDFRQYEKLVEPIDGYFEETNSKIRNDISGLIPDAQPVYASLFLGMQYDIRLNANSDWLLAPTITYNFGRSDIIKFYDWQASALMLGFQLKYSPRLEVPHEIFEQVINIDTLTIINEDIIHNQFKFGMEQTKEYIETKNGKIIHKSIILRTDTIFKRPVPRVQFDVNAEEIELESRYITQVFPLIPAVFFPKNSADLNMYYNVDTDINTFVLEKMSINALEYQKNLLNIIAKRMQEIPNAKLYINAYCDTLSDGVNTKLTKSRAEAIAEYLHKKWHIKQSQLIIRHSPTCHPPAPTLTRNDSGFADNSRAELSSDNPKLLAPIKNKRYSEPIKINPPVLRFVNNGSTKKGIARWSIVIRKGDKVISQHSGNGFPDVISDTLTYKDLTMLFSAEPLKVEISMIDFEGQIGKFEKTIPINVSSADYEIQRLSLILFNVSDDKLNKTAKNIIKDFVHNIADKSIIRVKGYTDRLGTLKYNRELSQRRAENTAAYIHKIVRNATIKKPLGYASSEFPPGINSYKTPIERFLSRTVFIEVWKKIK